MSSTSTHHHQTRPLDAMAAAIVLVLCLSWGFNQVATKLAIHDIPPLIQGAIRSSIAALMVAGWCKARGIPLLTHDGTLAAGLVAGALFGAEFTLIYQGLNLHHRHARDTVHLSRAVFRGARRPHFSARRPLPPAAVARPVAVFCRHVGGVRGADAGARSASDAGRRDDGRLRIALGRHHADHQGERAQPRARPRR